LIAVQKRLSLVYIYREKAITKETLELSGVDHITARGKTVILSDLNGQIFSLNVADFPALRPVSCISSDYISALAVNGKFSTMAAGTQDGHIVVCSIINGSFRFSCEVGEAPAHILITDSWGFILIAAGQKLHLFSTNGRPIRDIAVTDSVTQMVTWQCDCGIDFVAIATEQGQICVFEAFYLRLDEFVVRVKSKVLAMHYLLTLRSLAVVTADGEAHLIPWEDGSALQSN
jgi:hypothetical protein